MLEKLTELKQQIETALSTAADIAEVDALRVKMLGRKGEITLLLKNLGSLSPDERKTIGQKANAVRDFVTQSLETARIRLEAEHLNQSLLSEDMDITLPGKRRKLGRLHPVTTITNELESLFVSLGFDIVEGPLIETVRHNFDALNHPHNHPSRDEADTFYIAGANDGYVLRTHTSPMQVRTMESRTPPIRVVVPGMVARNDDIDATHTPVFHQMEGLVVDKGITFSDLRGMLDIIVRYTFGEEASVRLRPSHFPFTEPSAEVDISCYACGASAKKPAREDCATCKGTGWVELWGCGMVHPEVLRMSGIDPTIYSGYAFGLGTLRITSAHYGIPILKPYFENDVQFLNQF